MSALLAGGIFLGVYVLIVTERVHRTLAALLGASLVVLDPALPLGLIGLRLALPYAVVLHGAEVTVPGRLPGSRRRAGVGPIDPGARPGLSLDRGSGARRPKRRREDAPFRCTA